MDVSGRVVSGDQVYVDLDTIYDSICICKRNYEMRWAVSKL